VKRVSNAVVESKFHWPENQMIGVITNEVEISSYLAG